MKRLVGGLKPEELVHVDMRARLELGGLVHHLDHPHLWPPTLAVCFPARLRILRGWRLRQVRDLASEVAKLKNCGESKPFVAVELKKCGSILRYVVIVVLLLLQVPSVVLPAARAIDSAGKGARERRGGRYQGCHCDCVVLLWCLLCSLRRKAVAWSSPCGSLLLTVTRLVPKRSTIS